jgi:hypothetical protein
MCYVVILFGLGGDFSWHMFYWGESFHILPHYLMWLGGSGFTICLLILKLKRYPISTFAILIYPLFVIMGELWGNSIGAYLHENSGTFWTPPRFCLGLTMMYMLYSLYKTNIEKNAQVVTYLKTLIFFVLPIRWIHYMLIPLAIFSIHTELHTPFSLMLSVLVVLLVCTMYQAVNDDHVLLPGILMFAAVRGPFLQFFVDIRNVYTATNALFFIYFCVFLVLVSKRITRLHYALLACVVVTHVFTLQWAAYGAFDAPMYLLWVAGAALFASLYKDAERLVLPYMQRTIHALARLD